LIGASSDSVPSAAASSAASAFTDLLIEPARKMVRSVARCPVSTSATPYAFDH